jgi:hypothetical protein
LVHQRREGLAGVAGRAIALEYHFMAVRLKTVDPTHKRRRTVKKADSLSMRMNATGRPIAREWARTLRQLSSARSISEIASSRGFARYSCCISTKTTIGTLDAFANARRLTTEVTRLPFEGSPG